MRLYKKLAPTISPSLLCPMAINEQRPSGIYLPSYKKIITIIPERARLSFLFASSTDVIYTLSATTYRSSILENSDVISSTPYAIYTGSYPTPVKALYSFGIVKGICDDGLAITLSYITIFKSNLNNRGSLALISHEIFLNLKLDN